MTSHTLETDLQIKISFTGAAHQQLCSLMKRTVATTRALVVRNALRFFSYLRAEVLKGAKVSLGKEGPEFEVDILSVPPLGGNDSGEEEPYDLLLTIDAEAAALMEEMRKELRYENLREVVRHALAVYRHIVSFLKRKDEGDGMKYKLYLVRGGAATEQKDVPGLA